MPKVAAYPSFSKVMTKIWLIFGVTAAVAAGVVGAMGADQGAGTAEDGRGALERPGEGTRGHVPRFWVWDAVPCLASMAVR